MPPTAESFERSTDRPGSPTPFIHQNGSKTNGSHRRRSCRTLKTRAPGSDAIVGLIVRRTEPRKERVAHPQSRNHPSSRPPTRLKTSTTTRSTAPLPLQPHPLSPSPTCLLQHQHRPRPDQLRPRLRFPPHQLSRHLNLYPLLPLWTHPYLHLAQRIPRRRAHRWRLRLLHLHQLRPPPRLRRIDPSRSSSRRARSERPSMRLRLLHQTHRPSRQRMSR